MAGPGEGAGLRQGLCREALGGCCWGGPGLACWGTEPQLLQL